MFVHTDGRSVHLWAAALDRWDIHQRLVRGITLSEANYRELLDCCFEFDSVGFQYYTANADKWLTEATATGATKRFLEVVKAAFADKFGEPTQAENLAWLKLTMDPINQTPNTYAALVRQKGDTMVKHGRATKSDVIWKFLKTLPLELQNMMQEFQNVHSPYSGKYELQFYADRADLIWQTMAQSQLDEKYSNRWMAEEQSQPRRDSRTKTRQDGKRMDSYRDQEQRQPNMRRTKQERSPDREPTKKWNLEGTRWVSDSRQGSPDRRASRSPQPERPHSSDSKPSSKWQGYKERAKNKPKQWAVKKESNRPAASGTSAKPNSANVTQAEYDDEEWYDDGNYNVATMGYVHPQEQEAEPKAESQPATSPVPTPSDERAAAELLTTLKGLVPQLEAALQPKVSPEPRLRGR